MGTVGYKVTKGKLWVCRKQKTYIFFASPIHPHHPGGCDRRIWWFAKEIKGFALKLSKKWWKMMKILKNHRYSWFSKLFKTTTSGNRVLKSYGGVRYKYFKSKRQLFFWHPPPIPIIQGRCDRRFWRFAKEILLLLRSVGVPNVYLTLQFSTMGSNKQTWGLSCA